MLSERTLAEKFNVSRSTVRKWKYRETVADRSHRPHRLHTALSPAQEDIVVELRRSLLLSTDDLLVVVREFIQPDLNRSTLQRLLVRHGVSDRRALISQPEGEARPKTFKDYQPSYVHLDIKHLPAMADEDRRTYLFVAIDRASRQVYLERHREKSRKAATRFFQEPAGEGPVSSAHPAHGQQPGLDGPVSEEEPAALGQLPPVRKLKDWQTENRELFRKQVDDQSGLYTSGCQENGRSNGD